MRYFVSSSSVTKHIDITPTRYKFQWHNETHPQSIPNFWFCFVWRVPSILLTQNIFDFFFSRFLFGLTLLAFQLELVLLFYLFTIFSLFPSLYVLFAIVCAFIRSRKAEETSISHSTFYKIFLNERGWWHIHWFRQHIILHMRGINDEGLFLRQRQM